MKICLNCQTQNIDEAIYCKECGKKIKSRARKIIEIIIAIYAIFWVFRALI
jgi:uncharacterized membrane protein YvbJ